VSVTPYLYFGGNCREALDFYAAAFHASAEHVMTYGDAPGAEVSAADRDRVLYATMPVFGTTIMFSDCSSAIPYTTGNHIGLTLGLTDADEARRGFAALSDGGVVDMPLGPTFFSPLFGMVTDRFGVIWMVSLDPA